MKPHTVQPEQRNIQNHLTFDVVAPCKTACGKIIYSRPHPCHTSADVDCRSCQRTKAFRKLFKESDG